MLSTYASTSPPRSAHARQKGTPAQPPPWRRTATLSGTRPLQPQNLITEHFFQAQEVLLYLLC
jgi:hypothetical protein